MVITYFNDLCLNLKGVKRRGGLNFQYKTKKPEQFNYPLLTRNIGRQWSSEFPPLMTLPFLNYIPSLCSLAFLLTPDYTLPYITHFHITKISNLIVKNAEFHTCVSIILIIMVAIMIYFGFV